MKHPRLFVLAASITAAVLVGCGVPTDDAPRAVAEDEIPEALVAAPTTTTTPPDGVEANLFYVQTVDNESALVRLAREVDDRMVESVLEALVATVPEDLPPSVSTAIPPDVAVLSATIDDGVVTIDLSEEFRNVSGEPRIQAVAQIVFTATDLSAVDSVLFSVEGEDELVPDDAGSDIDGPATRADYVELFA